MDKKLTIIVPFRDRYEHLGVFLKDAPNFVNVNNFDILVVNQDDNKPFNRAKLLNIGFDHTKDKSDYFCFHDIDMIPQQVDYSYPDKPYHLAFNVPQFCHYYYGGVNIFNKEDFLKINGYSNEFWGWGGEDNDLLNRVMNVGYDVYRRNGFFKCLSHKPNGPDHADYTNNVNKITVKYDYSQDGLSNLSYNLKSVDRLSAIAEMINVTL